MKLAGKVFVDVDAQGWGDAFLSDAAPVGAGFPADEEPLGAGLLECAAIGTSLGKLFEGVLGLGSAHNIPSLSFSSLKNRSQSSCDNLATTSGKVPLVSCSL